MSLLRSIGFALSLLFVAALAFSCYRRPILNFDRYIYEAIVLAKSQPMEAVYEKVKHEAPRAENSPVLDSPQHLRELSPLYTIRPLYVKVIAWAGAFLPIQDAITFVSAGSLFAIGTLVLLWTRRPIETALMMASYPILVLGRMGTPDALSALFVLGALWLIASRQQTLAGLLLLLISLAVRTDNVLVLLSVLVWLAWERKIPPWLAALGSILGVGIVWGIDHQAGNYGWIVLFRYSFIAGKYPAQLPHTLSLGNYLSAFAAGLSSALPQFSIWILLGLWAWMRRPSPLLLVASAALAAHFLLFPSPEVRYLLWGGMLAAILLICSFADQSPGDQHRLIFRATPAKNMQVLSAPGGINSLPVN